MSVAHIHVQASVAPTAKLGSGVQIGPYAVVGDNVELGDGCILHSHAVVSGPSKIGRDNVFHPFSAIGGDPQDLGFRGEHVELIVGDGNTFREYVTVNRGTVKGGGKTVIGSRNLFLASSHVGHDSVVGDGNLFVNSATLAGHVTVEDFTTIGFASPVHQFCRVGRYAYIGASTVITQDVPPFSLVVTERETVCFGINKIGLQRKGFSDERQRALQRAYKLLLRSKLNTNQALSEMRVSLSDSPDVAELIRFIETSERGIVK
ncbi:MAG TPA: acyl-ACP--UDP-N-acetylglucosamine O-acyltransferase [Candidatus Acidoferrum sp.]|jgi:UDP-N-acetylglucosamine acyltransferase